MSYVLGNEVRRNVAKYNYLRFGAAGLELGVKMCVGT